jgi:hypothetical protein
MFMQIWVIPTWTRNSTAEQRIIRDKWLFTNYTETTTRTNMVFVEFIKPEYLRKSTTFRKSLTNFITYCRIEYTSPWTGFELTTLVVIGTDCTSSCKSKYNKTKAKYYIVQWNLSKSNPESESCINWTFKNPNVQNLYFLY